MYFSRFLLVASSFIAAASAQNTPLITFTTLPGSVVTAGQPVPLAWSGGDGVSPVTITLKQGPSTNLATVSIITSDATGNSYTWTPSTSLPDATDYLLQISQGDNDVNYSGQFAIVSAAATTLTTAFSPSATALGGATTISTSASATSATALGGTTATSITMSSTSATAAGGATTTSTIASATSTTAVGGATTTSTTVFSTPASASTAITLAGGATTQNGNIVATATLAGSGSLAGTGHVEPPLSTPLSGTGTLSPSATPTGAASNIGGSSLVLVLCAVVGIFVLK